MGELARDMLGAMSDVLDRLQAAPGIYWGHGDGLESGPFVGRVEVELLLNAVMLHYEAHGTDGLQHVEHTLLARGSRGLELHALIDTRQEVMTFSEREPGVFRLDASVDMRILIEVAKPGVLSYAWWWAPPGDDVIERSKLVAHLGARS